MIITMKLILFGDMQNWNRGVEILTAYRPDIVIAGLSSLDLGSFHNSDTTYTLREVQSLYQNHLIDGVINLQGENPYYFNLLKDLGISDIFVIPHTLYCRLDLGEDIAGDAVVYPYKAVLPELMQLEVHLADHCNLNCKGCSHFSNLVSSAKFADFNQFRKDILQLTHYFSQIHTFFLLGGENLYCIRMSAILSASCGMLSLIRISFL